MTKKDRIFELINQEEARQRAKIGLIPSENHCSPAVMEALGSCLTSKYSEGYPGRRYYEGNQVIDQIEIEAQERLKKLFGVPHVNVQPYSGSPANSAVEFALLEPGDTLMGLALSSGGHLTHGHPKVTFSGKFFHSVQYGLDDTARIDYAALRKLALEQKPKLIIAGNTAYPFILDFAKFAEIAQEVGAYLLADISHITGLVLAGEHPSPIPYADVVMTTTHKTFRGPRGAVILVTEKGLAKDKDLAKKIDSAVFPGMQGGPHNATTAGIALAAAEAMTPAYRHYGQQVRRNAEALAKALQAAGLKLVGDGTQTHLMLVDLTPFSVGMGTQAAFALDVAGIYANRNTIPNEPGSAFAPSGLRLGTPLVTTRGMKEPEMTKIAQWIAAVIDHIKDEKTPQEPKARTAFFREFRRRALQDPFLLALQKEVAAFAQEFPLFAEMKEENEK
jgi:glycine hydroxymethyltransferase